LSEMLLVGVVAAADVLFFVPEQAASSKMLRDRIVNFCIFKLLCNNKCVLLH
jgi:hypothetical protein